MSALNGTANGAVTDQIAALTRRVAALEARPQQQSEQNSPNYLTITPSGVVGALFPGGVQMIEGTVTSYTPAASVGWLDNVDQTTVREFIKGQVAAGAHRLMMISNPDGTDQVILLVSAKAAGAAGTAQAAVSALDNTGASAAAILLNSLGQSTFLQLGLSAILSTAGSGTVTWPGGSMFSSALVVTLTGASSTCFAVASIDFASGFDQAVLQVQQGVGAVTISAVTRGGGSPPLGTTGKINYLVWGT